MKVLCVIDMQRDFIDGALGTCEAAAILPAVRKKLELYRKNKDKIFFTRDTHPLNYLETSEGKHLPVEHCIRGTEGWEISPELDATGCEIIDKPTFGSLSLAERMGELEDIEEIEIIGLCTDICVISNALILKARLPEVPITVDSSCCAGVTPESHLNALESMRMCQINII